MRVQVRARAWARPGAVTAALACVLAGLGAVPASAAACQGFTGGQPPQADDMVFSGVAVPAACDAWAVGNSSSTNNAFIEHWTGGSSWTRVPVPDPGRTSLDGISAVSATDIWAVGKIQDPQPGGGSTSAAFVIHWDGTSWTRVPSPALSGMQQAGFLSVAATSASDAWATGFSADGAGHEFTLTEHWDGTGWAQVASPAPGGFAELHSVSAVPAGDAWAVGDAIDATSHHAGTLILRRAGSSWTQVPSPSPGPDSSLSSVSVRSASDAWAVGEVGDGAGGSSTVIEHWDGSSWTRVPSPAPGRNSQLSAVAAVSASSAWAAGTYFDASSGQQPLVLHWDGTAWSQQVAPAGFTSLQALGASAAGGLWLAGYGGDGIQAFAAPLTQAQVAVNANGALAESGFVTRSVAAANLAPGTNPGVAVQPDGSSLVAWQASSGLLWTLDSAGNKVNTQHQVAAGTSPAVAADGGNGFAVVFADAADNILRMLGPNGSANALGNGPAVAAGTSPAIAGDGNGGFEVAYHAAGTDHLWTVTQAGATRDTGAVMAAGASPAVTALPGGGFEAVYPSGSGALTGIGPDGTARPLGSGPGVAAGTSPAAAVDTHGTLEAVFQASGTGELWTVNAGTARDAGVAAAAGTSPAIAALVSGGFEIAWQATAGRELFTLAGTGPSRDAGFALGVHDSPAMAVLPPTPTRTTVPPMIGAPDAFARTELAAAALTVGLITADNTCQADAGIVTAQQPGAGAVVIPGTPVSLAESSGKTPQGTPCHPVVPNLFGDSDQAARTALAGQGLVVGQVTTGSSCQVSKGDVFSQSISANAAVAPGMVVSFVESNGLDRNNKPCNVE